MKPESTKKQKAIARELKRLSKANGGLLLPEQVVESARDEASPLHSQFEWDDTKAAEEYRLWQARQLIVRVKVETVGGQVEQMFVSLRPDREREGGGYRALVEVLSDEAMRQQLLSDALAELETFKRRYQELKELAEVFEAMKKVKTVRKAA